MNQQDNRITLENIETMVCANIQGRLDTLQSELMEQTLAPVLQKQHCLLIDLSECRYISSTGIRILMRAHKTMHAKDGGKMIIAQPSSEVMQVFEMAGLNQVFAIFPSKDQALESLLAHIRGFQPVMDKRIGQWTFSYQRLDHPVQTARVWTEQGIAGYDELALAIGKGYSAEMAGQDEPPSGWFVCTGYAAAFLPDSKLLDADFRISADPVRAGIVVQEALSVASKPSVFITLANKEHISWPELVMAVEALIVEEFSDPMLVLIIAADQNQNQPSVDITWHAIGKAHHDPLLDQLSFPGKPLLDSTATRPTGATFRLNSTERIAGQSSLNDFLKKTIGFESLSAVGPIPAGKILTSPRVWITVVNKCEDAVRQRTEVIANSDFTSGLHKPFLTRRLYKDSSRVELKQLHGGFSAQTFHVTSFDHENRKLRPTVMKIAHRDLIDREASRCRQYALPYIMNNSAMVLGTEFMGSTGALRYNFVGLDGEHTRLKWLTDYYKSWPVEKLEPLFDKIFLQILQPWYGQPVKQTIFPFQDHDPTKTFFPHIFEEAEKLLGVSADEPTITVEQTGQTLTNPYWYLKCQYPKMYNWSLEFYTSICHGDLNMQNVLLDDNMNIYLIDFSETRPRSVVSDFARLEAIFLIEQTPLHTPDDFNCLADILQKSYHIEKIDEGPDYGTIHDDALAKSVAMTMKMRQYASSMAMGYVNPIPYYIALLEWLLPVVCYTTDLNRKKASMIAASMVCHTLKRLID